MANYDHFAQLETPELQKLKTRTNSWDRHSYVVFIHALDCKTDSEDGRDEYQGIVHRSTTYSGSVISHADRGIPLMDKLGLTNAPKTLPPLSSILELEFTLRKPYLSRDEAPFYPVDNAVRRDFVFKVPMISGSSWKGSLRAAAVENLILRKSEPSMAADERFALTQIFGDEKGSDDIEDSDRKNLTRFLDTRLGPEARALFRAKTARPGATEEQEAQRRKGRLRCLPTYFNAIELDVINPRNRNLRKGTIPIHLENVPAGTAGKLAVVHFPFDLIGLQRPAAIAECQRDWALISEAVTRMLVESGFGAKKSMGWGRAERTISNFRFRSDLAGELFEAKPQGFEVLAKCVERFSL